MYTPVNTNFTIYKSDVFLFVFRIILLDDALDCLISFTDFIFAFQVQFYYEGESCRKVCKYLKVPKFSDTRKLCCYLPKIQKRGQSLGYFVKKMQME